MTRRASDPKLNECYIDLLTSLKAKYDKTDSNTSDEYMLQFADEFIEILSAMEKSDVNIRKVMKIVDRFDDIHRLLVWSDSRQPYTVYHQQTDGSIKNTCYEGRTTTLHPKRRFVTV